MADLKKALAEVKGVARTFQAVIDLAAALDNVASVAQAAQEAQARLERILIEIELQTDMLAKAKAEAGTVEAHAHQKAHDIVKVAAEGAAQTTRKADDYMARLKVSADAMAASSARAADAAQIKLEASSKELAARTQDLADVEAKINRVRAKMAEMLGG